MEKKDKLCPGGKLCLEGIFRQGYGVIPKLVMHDQNLTLESKAIYAYLCALAGSGDTTFPYRDTILRDLGLSKNTYYRHYNLLLDEGYITVTRPPDKTAANIYTLVQNPKNLPERPLRKGSSHLLYRGLKSHGYGSLPRAVMLDECLSLKAKGLYAYLCSYCGGGNCAFPKKDNILFHLGISEPTYYKALNQLKDAGYLETCQRKDDKGQFDINDYFLNDHPAKRGAGDNLPTPETKPVRSAPNKDKPAANPGARTVCCLKPPIPKNGDMENPYTKKRDIKKSDNISNNSSSSNNPSSISPSICAGDGPIHALVSGLIEELIEKPPRKNQGTALAARECLFHVQKEKEGEEGLVRLREDFVSHLEKGLRGKQVRNLKAYCKTSLHNWLEERFMLEGIKKQPAIPRPAASYDLGELERLVEDGGW